MTEGRGRDIQTFANIRNAADFPTIAAHAKVSATITIATMPITGGIGGGVINEAGLIDTSVDMATVTRAINRGVNAALGTDIPDRDTTRTLAKAFAALPAITPIGHGSISDNDAPQPPTVTANSQADISRATESPFIPGSARIDYPRRGRFLYYGPVTMPV